MTREATSPLLLHKIPQIPPILFRRPPDLALPFAGIETGGLVLQTLDLLGGCDVDIIGDRFTVLDAVVEKPGHFYPPAFGFCLDLIFIADTDISGGLGAKAIVLDFAFVAGIGGVGPGLEETDGPEIFVEADLLFLGHNDGRRPDEVKSAGPGVKLRKKGRRGDGLIKDEKSTFGRNLTRKQDWHGDGYGNQDNLLVLFSFLSAISVSINLSISVLVKLQ